MLLRSWSMVVLYVCKVHLTLDRPGTIIFAILAKETWLFPRAARLVVPDANTNSSLSHYFVKFATPLESAKKACGKYQKCL